MRKGKAKESKLSYGGHALCHVQMHAYLVGAAYNLLRLARLQPLTG